MFLNYSFIRLWAYCILFITLAYLIESKTSQNKTKTQSQEVGMFAILQISFTTFNLFKFSEHGSCYDRVGFYCQQAVTLRKVQCVDGNIPGDVHMKKKCSERNRV